MKKEFYAAICLDANFLLFCLAAFSCLLSQTLLFLWHTRYVFCCPDRHCSSSAICWFTNCLFLPSPFEFPAIVLKWPMCGQKSLHQIPESNPRIHPSEMPGLLKHCSVLALHSWSKAECTPLTHGCHLVYYYLQFHGYKPPVAWERYASSKEADALNLSRVYDHWACNTLAADVVGQSDPFLPSLRLAAGGMVSPCLHHPVGF